MTVTAPSRPASKSEPAQAARRDRLTPRLAPNLCPGLLGALLGALLGWGLLTAGAARAQTPPAAAARTTTPTPGQRAGDAAFARRDYPRAVAAYAQAVAQAPTDVELRYRLGVAQAAAGQLDAATASWEQVLALAPRHARARRNLLLARRRLALTQPRGPDLAATRQLAAELVAAGRMTAALAVLDELLERPPETQRAELFALRATARFAAGDPAGASADWLTVLALEPSNPRAFLGLARCHAAQGDLARRDYFLERARASAAAP